MVFQFLTRCASSTITSSGSNQIEIGLEFLVVGDLAEVVRRVVLLPLRPATRKDACRAPGKARNLALPLVLERSRANDKHFGDAEMPGQNFRRRNGLDGLAQPHFVSNQ
jgi:hypothetical protein